MLNSDDNSSKNDWFLIVNPNTGNSNFSKSWKIIQDELKSNLISYEFAFSQFTKHEIQLVEEAIKQGYRKIISVGGDGTLHHVVNGIMVQTYVKTSDIKLGVIPLGTGNDWIKSYNIPNTIKDSIHIIENGTDFYQDIGCIELENNRIEYFNNLAGIGYDGYVIHKLKKLKRFGAVAYILSGLYGLFFYRKTSYKIEINNTIITSKCLMILIGLCQYSGGGMQMTQEPLLNDGLFDVTLVKNFSFLDLIINLPKLYNGTIVNHKKVENFKTSQIKINELNTKESFIEADGELVGKHQLKVAIIKKSIRFIIPNNTIHS